MLENICEIKPNPPAGADPQRPGQDYDNLPQSSGPRRKKRCALRQAAGGVERHFRRSNVDSSTRVGGENNDGQVAIL